jgi:hypothetical protein
MKEKIEQLASPLSSAGYTIRSLKPIMSQKSLRTIYFSYGHSTMLNGMIFMGQFE